MISLNRWITQILEYVINPQPLLYGGIEIKITGGQPYIVLEIKVIIMHHLPYPHTHVPPMKDPLFNVGMLSFSGNHSRQYADLQISEKIARHRGAKPYIVES